MRNEEYEIKNALITGADILYENGWLTFRIWLKYGAGAQGFGGYVFCHKDTPVDRPDYGAVAAMNQILQTVGVESWATLKGAYCRVESSFSRVRSIGHILKEKWFDVEAHFKAACKRRETADGALEPIDLELELGVAP